MPGISLLVGIVLISSVSAVLPPEYFYGYGNNVKAGNVVNNYETSSDVYKSEKITYDNDVTSDNDIYRDDDVHLDNDSYYSDDDEYFSFKGGNVKNKNINNQKTKADFKPSSYRQNNEEDIRKKKVDIDVERRGPYYYRRQLGEGSSGNNVDAGNVYNDVYTKYNVFEDSNIHYDNDVTTDDDIFTDNDFTSDNDSFYSDNDRYVTIQEGDVENFNVDNQKAKANFEPKYYEQNNRYKKDKKDIDINVRKGYGYGPYRRALSYDGDRSNNARGGDGYRNQYAGEDATSRHSKHVDNDRHYDNDVTNVEKSRTDNDVVSFDNDSDFSFAGSVVDNVNDNDQDKDIEYAPEISKSKTVNKKRTYGSYHPWFPRYYY